MKDFSELVSLAKAGGTRRVVLIGSEDREGIRALKHAFDEGIATPVFVGREAETLEILKEEGLDGEVIPASSRRSLREGDKVS